MLCAALLAPMIASAQDEEQGGDKEKAGAQPPGKRQFARVLGDGFVLLLERLFQEQVMELIDLARAAGIDQFSFMVEQETS